MGTIKGNEILDSNNVKDWNGNLIKEGDTVIVVRTKPIFGKSVFGFATKDGFKKVFEQKPPKHIWKPIKEVLVQKNDYRGLSYSVKSEGTEYSFDLSMIQLGQTGDVICIKGKSDNEEMYYEKFPKQ